MSNETCLFCKIIARDIPSTMVYEDELVVAIDDIAPVAPVHQLLMSRAHIESAADLSEEDGPMLGRLFAVGAQLARDADLPDDGYRLVTNVGENGGQSVPHLHVHLLGGRRLAWPPG